MAWVKVHHRSRCHFQPKEKFQEGLQILGLEVPKQTSERVTRERVPQIITKDWTKANRDRANEVTLQLEPHVMYTLNYSEHGR